MSYYESPEQLAANPPETWRVAKRGERFALYIDDSDSPLATFITKREALAERDDPQSRTRRDLERERLWYEGVTPAGWNSWAECLAQRERIEARWGKRPTT